MAFITEVSWGELTSERLDRRSRCGSGGSSQAWDDNCRFVLSMLTGTSYRSNTRLCTCDLERHTSDDTD